MDERCSLWVYLYCSGLYACFEVAGVEIAQWSFASGISCLRPEHVIPYYETFNPLALRWASGLKALKPFEDKLEFSNFGEVKGVTVERVLIFPTDPIMKFLKNKEQLTNIAAAKFYVAVTRARDSVAIVWDEKEEPPFPFWEP